MEFKGSFDEPISLLQHIIDKRGPAAVRLHIQIAADEQEKYVCWSAADEPAI